MESNNTMFQYTNALRSHVDSSSYLHMIGIIKRISKEKKDGIENLDQNEILQLLSKASISLGIEVPNISTEEFTDLIVYLRRLEEPSWMEIITDSRGMKKFKVSSSLFDLLINNYNENHKSVLITEAEKLPFELYSFINKNPQSDFVLTSDDLFYCEVLKEIYKEIQNVKVIHTSIYEYEFINTKFDFILSVPDYGIRDRADQKSTFISRELSFITLENLLLHLNSDGELSIVLPNRITFGVNEVHELREFIENMYSLNEISELPSGVFMNTGIRSCLLRVSQGRTDEVFVKRYKLENSKELFNSKLELENETFVIADELRDMGSWNLERIFQSQDEEWIKFNQSDLKKEELGDLATIFRGKAVSKKVPNGHIGVINISDIGEYEVDYSNLDFVDFDHRKVSNYILQNGDLLLPARGTVIRIAKFEEQSFKVIASSNVIVIRPKEHLITPEYLKLFLDSPIGKKMLLARQQGTTIINISYRELASILIPVPDKDEQERVSKIYQEELEIYKQSINEAEQRWNETISRLRKQF